MESVVPESELTDKQQDVGPKLQQSDQISNQLPTSLPSSSSSPPRLFLLYGIIISQLIIFLSEMVIDQLVHSTLILADAYHHLFNTFNAILMVVCYKISNQMTVKNTFGWVRTEILGMLTTITFIVALIFSLLIEGALQLLHLHEISGPTSPEVLIKLGIWSLIVNISYVLVINGVVTDKKYKQTTEKERSFSTAKCQKSKTTLTKINDVFNSHHQNNDDNVSDNKKNFKKQKSNQNNQIIKNVEIIFPRSNQQQQEEEEDNYLDLNPKLFDDEFNIEFSTIEESNELSTLSPSPKTIFTSKEFCNSFIQGILSPCFVILCSIFITIFQKSNLYKDYVEMIDPSIGIITVISLCLTFYPQMKNRFLILMQTVPENVNIVQLKREIMQKFNCILNIHEFHIWLLTSSNIVATLHIVLPIQNTKQYCKLYEEIKNFLKYRYGINFITIQPEFLPKENEKTNKWIRRHSSCLDQCLVKCPCDSNGKCNVCSMKSCCLTHQDGDDNDDGSGNLQLLNEITINDDSRKRKQSQQQQEINH